MFYDYNSLKFNPLSLFPINTKLVYERMSSFEGEMFCFENSNLKFFRGLVLVVFARYEKILNFLIFA